MPLEIDEIVYVRVSQTARDSFRFHHGGSDRAAEVNLRNMLEDFLLRSARTEKGAFVLLAREGYELILDHQFDVITGYRTAHKERTWEQVKAGVASRYGRKARPSRQPSPELGSPLAVTKLAESIQPGAIHLTGRVRTSFARIFHLQTATDDDLDAALRRRLAKDVASATPGARKDDYAVELVSDDLTWLVRPDALALIGVKRSS